MASVTCSPMAMSSPRRIIPASAPAASIPISIGVSEEAAPCSMPPALPRALPDAAAGERFIPWGYSQGGHAALWAG